MCICPIVLYKKSLNGLTLFPNVVPGLSISGSNEPNTVNPINTNPSVVSIFNPIVPKANDVATPVVIQKNKCCFRIIIITTFYI